jgi:Fibronectin type III domain/IPT/TIG domain
MSKGTTYTFTVAARNAAGLSAPSAPSNSVTAITVPAAPRVVVARAGNASATVSWQAPTSDGGAAISGYTVDATHGGAGTTVDAAARTAVVTNLRNGVSYTFEVSAYNAAGAGASYVSNAVTPHAPAVRPKVVRVTPSSGPHGATVTIHGTGFAKTTAVTFHSTRATFRVVSQTLLRAIVPRRATTGRITIRTHGGAAATSVHVFKVTKRVRNRR